VDELNEKLADAAARDAAPPSAVLGQYGGGEALARQRESVASELAAMRDAAGKRLATTVAALENIRLDLLRLQAGAGSVESLTAALEAARRVGDEVDATVAGRSLAGTAPATGAR
jgi:hypothetical protein